MGMAITLKHYLDSLEVDYELMTIPTQIPAWTLREKHMCLPKKIAKCIMLEDEGGYVMAVCPASSRIKLGNLYREINRRLEFSSEQELAVLLGDCVLGAVPPIGDVYDIEVVIDDELLTESDIYF